MKRFIILVLAFCMIFQSTIKVSALTISDIRNPEIKIPNISIPKINQDTLPDIKIPDINQDALQRAIKKPATPAAIDLNVNDNGKILSIVEKNLLDISIAASGMSGKPVDSLNGYTNKILTFLDWNLTDKSLWFRWNAPVISSKVIWQVSMMPFDGGTKYIDKPVGMVANGVLDRTQTEFSIDFSKFAPSSDRIKSLFANQAFVTNALQAFNTTSSIAVASDNKQRIDIIKSSLKKYSSTGNTPATNRIKKQINSGNINALSALRNIQNTRISQSSPEKNIISTATMKAQKNMMESLGQPQTQYKYYVRIIALDNNGKTTGKSSNSIEVLYGDPVFDRLTTTEKQSVLVAEQSGNFGGSSILFMDCKSAASSNIRTFQAPLPDAKNYAYSFFQVTTERPDSDRNSAFWPDGLVCKQLSQNLIYSNFTKQCISASIDFNKFVPKINLTNPVQIRYYVRAVHVFADFANPGHSKITFSPPMDVTYGTYDAKAVQDAYAVNVDIATPSIKFTQYTAPDHGRHPWNFVKVLKKPGDIEILGETTHIKTVFEFMEVGKIYNLGEIREWLEERQRNEPVLTQVLEVFGGLITGIADLINSVSAAWTQIQSSVVGLLAKVGIPESIGGFLVNAALAMAGIPPTLPNFEDFSVGQIAGYISQQSGGIIPQSIAESVAKEMIDQAEKIANTPIDNLEGDLAVLNGCVKTVQEFFWRPATVTFEIKNNNKNQIPSGQFDLKLVNSSAHEVIADTLTYYRLQRITYPSLKAGQSIKMTITLEENQGYWINRGDKLFPEEYYYSTKYSKEVRGNTWSKIVDYSSGLSALAIDITPHIPEPADLEKELGLVKGVFLVKFNVVNGITNIRQEIGKLENDWNTSSSRFPAVIHVSTSGNDMWDGSKDKPYKTLAKAAKVLGEGDTILLKPGTYTAADISINVPYAKIIGDGAGVILKGTSGCSSVIEVGSKATEMVMKNLTIDGGKSQSIWVNKANYVHLEDLKVINAEVCGIRFSGEVSVIRNCEISGSDKVTLANGDGILVEKSNNVNIQDCYIHDVKGNGIRILYSQMNIEVNGCNIARCGKSGIHLEGTLCKIRNCFIRDTDWAGLAFAASTDCNVTRCTLLDTGKKKWSPITFAVSPNGTNSMKTKQEQNYGKYPIMNYADHNIIVQMNTFKIALVSVEVSGAEAGLAANDYDKPWVTDNIYYYKSGKAQFFDDRPWDETHKADTGTIEASYSGGLENGWRFWVHPFGQDYSIEMNPQIDSKGRSVLKNCFGMGVE